MSSLVTEATRALSTQTRTTLGIVALLVLLIVLVMREMARAELGEERARRVAHLRMASVPLIAVFVGVVTPRIVELLT
jgi:uncharacterized protein involved in response to NO